MATIAETIDVLGTIAPWAKAAAWDPVGLQIGDPAQEVGTMAVCHEARGDILEKAEAAGVDLLVAYHPLLFRPTNRLVAGPGPAGRAYRLARSGIALAIVHTAFDVAPGGAADALAASIGLGDVMPFGPVWAEDGAKVVAFVPADAVDGVASAMGNAGAGVIGGYSACSFRVDGVGTFFAGASTSPVAGEVGELNAEPEVRLEMVSPRSRVDAVVAALVRAHPYEEPAYDVYDATGGAGFVGRIGVSDAASLDELVDRTDAALGARSRLARGGGGAARVAVIPGSGRSLIGEAASVGADVLITGDVSHHDARGAQDQGMSIIDPGHAASERPGLANLYAAVSHLGETVDLTGAAGPWEER